MKKKLLTFVLICAMLLAMTPASAVVSFAQNTIPVGTTNLPTAWNGKTLDWTYQSVDDSKSELGNAMWLQLIWGIDYNCPSWVKESLGLKSGDVDVSTWYGTDGTDGALAYLQELESGETYRLQFSYCIWDAVTEVETVVDGLTEEQLTNAQEAVDYFEFLKDCCVKAVGNVNGVNSSGVKGTKVQTAMLYMADIIRACGQTITDSADGHVFNSETDPYITIESGSVTIGKTVSLDMTLHNNPGIAGLGVYLNLPTGVTLTGTSDSAMTLTVDRMLVFDGSENFTGEKLVTLTFATDTSAVAGEYEIGLSLYEACDENLDDVALAVINGTLTVKDFTYGDVNGDDAINTKDIVKLRQYIANIDPYTKISTVSVTGGADVNADGTINTKDIVLLRQYIANTDPKTGNSTVTLGGSAVYPTSVSLNKTAATLTKAETVQLTATVLPDTSDKKTITWSSSNQSVATVSGTGLVTAVSAGSCVITAKTVNGKTATCKVTVTAPTSTTVCNIGSQRQVLWDDYIVDTSLTDAVLTLNHPTQQEVVYTMDAPWEGDSCDYYSIITVTRDDGSQYYRMYYNGWTTANVLQYGCSAIVICAIESEDGINWYRPDYGMIEYEGDKHTNIVMKTAEGFDNFFVFVDTNPNCPATEKYKAVSEYLGADDYGQLHGYVSADGLHWREIGRLRSTADGTFDSLNTCFYNEADGLYYLYYRGFHGLKNGKPYYYTDNPSKNTIRDIRVAKCASFSTLFTSSDFEMLTFDDDYDFALYTNNCQPYYRATQVILGLPTRYNDHDCEWSENMNYLPDLEWRSSRYQSTKRYATTVTDTLFMTSHDGVNFSRFTSAWYAPGAEHTGNWIYGDGYFAYGMIETEAEFADQDKELSLLTFESHGNGSPARVYRYTTRIDGFACYKAPSYDVSTLTTKLFTFTGDTLLLNFKTSGAGSIVIDFLDEDGNVIKGYTSYTIFGDKVDREITFGTSDLAALNGRNVRLRFTMRDAEVYSFKFE